MHTVDLADLVLFNRTQAPDSRDTGAAAGAGANSTAARRGGAGSGGRGTLAQHHDMPPSDTEQQPAAACPVDHKSREAWLSQARAAAKAAAEDTSPTTTLPPQHPSLPTKPTTNPDADACPVDHRAREVWVQQARATAASASQQPPPPTTTAQSAAAPGTSISSPPSSSSSWSSYLRLPSFLSSSSASAAPRTSQAPTRTKTQAPAYASPRLGTDREVSTIPRTPFQGGRWGEEGAAAAAAGQQQQEDNRSGAGGVPLPPPPANKEGETGADAATGNWVYPSERMFFEAMRRKGHDPRSADMRAVVPLHNAVNERAWAEIKAWEGPWVAGTSCGGPRLHSFSGLSTRPSPRARLNTLLGYHAPFDRHDWVVDRCGVEVEYVIDFYAGRRPDDQQQQQQQQQHGGQRLSFYLDVRPKLNSWEGVKMRAFRALGLT
ncbi:cytochrome c and c1 heme-lyase [Xylariaceae sp. FL0804]|nr:cytochrome c and c1 heme-lyase [Xylariaceae sp. FL0804]